MNSLLQLTSHSFVYAVAQRVSLKKSWKICGDIRVTVSSVANQLGALQEKGGECIKGNTILLVDIPEGVTEELLKSYLSIVTKLELADFSLEHKGTTALMVLHSYAAGWYASFYLLLCKEW